MNERPGLMQCPKCGYWSGDDWQQCEGLCPMPGSPHHDDLTAFAFSPFPDPTTNKEA